MAIYGKANSSLAGQEILELLMEPKGSFLYLQKPVTGHCPETAESS
jgi:hypothetical protein